ncbi:hypothetical protein Mycch_1697 [Mycolicibacterium chubuense NBB4]|uniref:Uncharacterized protein n=1 Tax=Mycolicibacterium chubuense (strain NBB4) TaxID=710421 RepID=I4BGT1_MYCCN|nr:hypothetical protein [Mycolicibacterium chubuense]AFM16488.1 hypothetical protein Mycch_1697 [Mycolicibacterium chubuense NBB4]
MDALQLPFGRPSIDPDVNPTPSPRAALGSGQVATASNRQWHSIRRKWRHLGRELRLRRDQAHPAFSYAFVGTLMLLTIGAVVYALMQH